MQRLRETDGLKEPADERLNGGDGESYAYGIEAHCIRCLSSKLPKILTMHMMHERGSTVYT